MVEEVMTALTPGAGSFQIDATVGGGGHALRILEAANPDGRLLGLDADPAAITRSRTRLGAFGERAVLVQANFERIGDVAREHGVQSMYSIDSVDNQAARDLAEHLGFQRKQDPNDATQVMHTLDLNAASA